jgi:hypothetical protein
MSGGYVYVIEFGNGTVKVGHTRAIANRLNTHERTARSFGLKVSRCWESPCHDGWLENERELMRLARELGGVPTTPEYFNGVSFDALVEKAGELPFPAPASAPAVVEAVAPQCGQDAGTAPATEGIHDRADMLAAIEARAARTARSAVVASLFLDLGISPEVMRNQMGRPGLAGAMEDMRHAEAAIRRDRAMAWLEQFGNQARANTA